MLNANPSSANTTLRTTFLSTSTKLRGRVHARRKALSTWLSYVMGNHRVDILDLLGNPNRHLHHSNIFLEMKGANTMKKIILKLAAILAVIAILVVSFTGCEFQTEADKVSYNLSKQADNFNVIRQLTVLNCIQGDVLFQMTGKMSITSDNADHQLEIVVEDYDGSYKKHFVGLSDNVTYVVEDLDTNYVSKYHYTLNFNPKMWIPVDVETID